MSSLAISMNIGILRAECMSECIYNNMLSLIRGTFEVWKLKELNILLSPFGQYKKIRKQSQTSMCVK